MSSAAESLEKLSTSDISPNGILDTDKVGFLEDLQENSDFLGQVRLESVSRENTRLVKLGVGERMLRPQAEGTAGGGQGTVTTSYIDISCEKASLYYNLTKEFVENSLEREQTATRVWNKMVRQYSIDLQDLAINGNDADADPFVSIQDGWLQLAQDGGMPTISHLSSGTTPQPQAIDEVVLNDAIQSMESKYLRENTPTFFMSQQQLQEFKFGQVSRSTPLGDAFLQGSADANPFGYNILAPAMWPHDKILFCPPQNLIYAVHRELELETMEQSDQIMAEDLYAKYAMRSKFDFAIEDMNAGVLITDVADPTA